MSISKADNRRVEQTLSFFAEYATREDKILDLGVENSLSLMIKENGYDITNTKGEDLDFHSSSLRNYPGVDLVTAFEILEHLVSPFEVLRNIPSNKLIATVPLRLWFAKAYRNISDPWDQHFHEFEDWQFDWLLEKAGWTIKARRKWKSPSSEIGLRPILRKYTDRYYAIYAEREPGS